MLASLISSLEIPANNKTSSNQTMTALTTAPQSATASALPEFAKHQTATALFGISRSALYSLAGEGRIKSVNLRKPGNIRGARLFDCASIRAFLNSSLNA